MKYIRTKDKIIDLANIKIGGSDGWKSKDEYIAFKQEDQIEKIKQADTIEELCDEFVIKGTRGLYLGIPLQECELRNIPITQIHGAIWTDKGLIYVAKMNEKGELELL